MAKPFEAASEYISRGTRHTLKHIAMLDTLTAEMMQEFDLKDSAASTSDKPTSWE